MPDRESEKHPGLLFNVQEIDDHGGIIALGTVPSNHRNPHPARQGPHHLGLILELGMLDRHRLELDRDFFVGNDVLGHVDVP